MPFRLALVILLLALDAGHAVCQGDGYTIRLKEMEAGDTTYVAKDERMTENLRIVTPLNMLVTERSTEAGEVTTYRETVLVRDKKGSITRLRRTFEKAQLREKGGQLRDLVYHGKTVLIERKGERFSFWLEGRGELTTAEAKLLDKQFNGADEKFSLRNLLPEGPVRDGDYPWPVNIKPLVRDLMRTGKIVADPLKSKGTGRMKRVYRDEFDRLCAELQFELEFPISMIVVGGQKTPLGPASRGIVETTLDLCIDGSTFYVTNKDTMRIEAAAGYRLPDGGPAMLAIQTQSNNTCVCREVPK